MQLKNSNKGKTEQAAIKIISFMLIFCILFSGLNIVFQPMWEQWNNYNTLYGFYKQPKNTIETVFLGTSTMIAGISPMEIYKNYGICSYNLATEQQPLLASYYWLEETYRLHPKSLKTVVIDVSGLRKASSASFYHKSLDAMRFSPVKFKAVMAHMDNFEDAIEYITPLLSYHERWKSLPVDELSKLKFSPDTSVRGYMFSNEFYLDTVGYDIMLMPEYIYDDSVEATELSDENEYYFDKMAQFCEDKGIKLVFVKNPSSAWESNDHKSAQNIADKYGLDFFDFNFEPYVDEIHYNTALDTMDAWHMNYSGTYKVSNWMGDYLINECDGTDVRGDSRFSFMDEELERYERRIVAINMNDKEDPCDYIEAYIQEGGFSIFITVRADAAKAMTEAQRQRFKDMGLTKLSDLGYLDSYIGMIDEGKVIFEEIKDSGSGEDADKMSVDLDDVKVEDIVTSRDMAISRKGKLSDGRKFDAASGGFFMGNIASCIIDDTEYALNKRGLNIIVYDNTGHNVADVISFNTYDTPVTDRNPQKQLDEFLSGNIDYDSLSLRARKLYLYNRRSKNERLRKSAYASLETGDAMDYLDTFWYDADYTIYLSTADNPSEQLDVTERTALMEGNMPEVSEIESVVIYDPVLDEVVDRVVFDAGGQ